MNAPQFQEVELEFMEKLCPLGYTRAIEEMNGPFGSHFVDYVLKGQAYRLIADGKESKLLVEFSALYSRPVPNQNWQSILCVPFPRTFNAASLLLLCQSVSLGLTAHQSSAA